MEQLKQHRRKKHLFVPRILRQKRAYNPAVTDRGSLLARNITKILNLKYILFFAAMMIMAAKEMLYMMWKKCTSPLFRKYIGTEPI